MIEPIHTLPSIPLFNESQEDPSLPTVIIHIGLPKTATTTLQQRLFPKIEDIHYLGKNSKNRKGTLLRDFLIYSLPNQHIISQKNPSFFYSKKPNLYSEERVYRKIFHDHNLELINKLKKIGQCNNLKLIITTRAQNHLIPSYYLFKICFTKTPNTPFEKRIFLTDQVKKLETAENNYWKVKKKHNITYLTDSSFDYLHLYKIFNQFIPQKNLLMLPMEGILSDDFSYREKLFHFITQRNPSESEKEMLKTFHLYQDNSSPHPNYKEELQRFKDIGYAKRIFEIYKKSNEQLSKLLSLDLKRFGYY